MFDDPMEGFQSVGLIAHHFETCEFYLSEIFQILCEADNEAPFLVFGLIVSSNMRLEMAKIALQQCLPRSSALKTELIDAFEEFKVCQTDRNRAVHSAHVPTLRRSKLAWHRRPLWHQTHRYKDGILKAGLERTANDLSNINDNILLLSLRLKSLIEQLDEFLSMRRSRRLRRSRPRV
jgi:hypothetical protein